MKKKNEAFTEESSNSSYGEQDIQAVSTLILQTMADFGKAYSQNYIAQFLTADKFLMLRQPEHRDLESYGKLRRMSMEDLICMIHFLVDAGYVGAKEPDYMAISLTQEGKYWLAQPGQWLVARQQVRYSPFEKYLRNSLREQRRDISIRLKLKPWEVITDYTLDRIVLAKPLDLDALSRLPGFDTRKCERFGADFVRSVQLVMEHFDEYQRASLLVKVKGGSFPRVKKLFQENVTIPEIAHTCSIQVGTVCSYLCDLHAANEIDLIPWMERNINSKSLFKGVEYFERVSRPRLKEAHAILGLDYNTLRFCQLYARDKRMRQEEEAMIQQDKAQKIAS